MRKTSGKRRPGRTATVDDPGRSGASTNLRAVGHQVDRDIMATAILHIPALRGAKGWGGGLVGRARGTHYCPLNKIAGVAVSYHSQNGREFVGLRTFINGRRQVVYDAAAGKRVIFEIGDPQASGPEIEEALREGVKSRNVLSGVLQALHRRNIRFDFPG